MSTVLGSGGRVPVVGCAGQVGAISLGICRALENWSKDNRPLLTSGASIAVNHARDPSLEFIT
jgi:ribosomal protein S9